MSFNSCGENRSSEIFFTLLLDLGSLISSAKNWPPSHTARIASHSFGKWRILCHVTLHTECEEMFCRFDGVNHREDNDFRILPFLQHGSGGLVAIHPWHLHIHQHQVNPLLFKNVKRFFSCWCFKENSIIKCLGLQGYNLKSCETRYGHLQGGWSSQK